MTFKAQLVSVYKERKQKGDTFCKTSKYHITSKIIITNNNPMSCQWHQTSKPGPLCLSGRRQCWRAGCQRPCSPFPGFHRFFSSKNHLKAMFPRLPPPLRATSRLPLHQRTISRQRQLRPAKAREWLGSYVSGFSRSGALGVSAQWR